MGFVVQGKAKACVNRIVLHGEMTRPTNWRLLYILLNINKKLLLEAQLIRSWDVPPP